MSSSNETAKTTQRFGTPVAKLRVGLATATIREYQTDRGPCYTTSFELRMRRDGKWRTSDEFDPYDLLSLAKLVDLAIRRTLPDPEEVARYAED